MGAPADQRRDGIAPPHAAAPADAVAVRIRSRPSTRADAAPESTVFPVDVDRDEAEWKLDYWAGTIEQLVEAERLSLERRARSFPTRLDTLKARPGLGWCHRDGWHPNVWTDVEPASSDSVRDGPRGVAEGTNNAGDGQ